MATASAPTKHEDAPETYTVEEVAKMLRISRQSAYSAVRNRTIPSVRIGRRLLVARVALERLLNG